MNGRPQTLRHLTIHRVELTKRHFSRFERPSKASKGMKCMKFARTMLGLEHLGVLKGEEYHVRHREQHAALVSELAS